ncbi:hypothetical protein I316_02154 [Kwoniella heveanensis BCC8398]|uniref:3-hydroxyisobutyrate dehydrogenase n=1 Tax=Kwoniella heveanensis BCC8398 TaxID=1296120 RepID=A0A1B9GZ33_9TREE|nr:hypothetical protein I316_02154 [Kwoniella heveanensis BCC8398]
MTETTKPVVGWIGLGAMGSGMATSLVRDGYTVKAYDVWKPSLQAVVGAGAQEAPTPADAAKGVQVLGLMVVNAQQVEDVIFGKGDVAQVLEEDAVIICFSTVPPSYLVSVAERLDALGKNIGLCDCPVSGGSTRAATGELAIMTSGTSSSVSRANPVLSALTKPALGALSIVGDKVGTASDFKLINQVFCAVQIAAQGEAIALAKNWGLNPRLVYNLIKGASGDSFMFGHRVPWSLNHDGVPKSLMTIISKDIGIVMDEARSLCFPAPMCAVSETLFTMAIGAGLQKLEDGQVSKVWESFGGVPIAEKGTVEEEEAKAKELDIKPASGVQAQTAKVLIVGLGAMGLPIAQALTKSSIDVLGYDANASAAERFTQQGGKVVGDLEQAGKDRDTVLLVVNTAKQAEEVLFSLDGRGLVTSLPQNSLIIICSTIPPSEAIRIQTLLDTHKKGHQLIDAPVSGGPSRAVKGDLSIFASGSEEALSRAHPILSVLSTSAGNANLHFIPGGLGSGSKIKLVNNLLAGIHLAVAAEGLAFAKYKKMDLDKVFQVVRGGAASSYMMIDRVPRMFEQKAQVFSPTKTFVKDLSIVLTEAKKVNTPLFLGSVAAQQFTRAVSEGWGDEDDSSVGRLWESMGVDLRH